jgi:hypothetical protein
VKYLGDICKIYKSAYHPDHFTSRFSEEKLARFYEILILSNEYCFVALDAQRKISGFIIAGYNTNKAVREFISENSGYLLRLMFMNPQFFLKGSSKVNCGFQIKTDFPGILEAAVDSY